MDCKEHVVSALTQLQERAALFAGFLLNFAGAKVRGIWVIGLVLMRPKWGNKIKMRKKIKLHELVLK